jgi:hypothetical protein
MYKPVATARDPTVLLGLFSRNNAFFQQHIISRVAGIAGTMREETANTALERLRERALVVDVLTCFAKHFTTNS